MKKIIIILLSIISINSFAQRYYADSVYLKGNGGKWVSPFNYVTQTDLQGKQDTLGFTDFDNKYLSNDGTFRIIEHSQLGVLNGDTAYLHVRAQDTAKWNKGGELTGDITSGYGIKLTGDSSNIIASGKSLNIAFDSTKISVTKLDTFVSGTGAAGRIAIWKSNGSQTGSPAFVADTVTKKMTITNNSLGSGTATSLELKNTTLATPGSQIQNPPAILQSGNVWRTTDASNKETHTRITQTNTNGSNPSTTMAFDIATPGSTTYSSALTLTKTYAGSITTLIGGNTVHSSNFYVDIRSTLASSNLLLLTQLTPATATNKSYNSPSILSYGTGWNGSVSRNQYFKQHITPIADSENAQYTWQYSPDGGTNYNTIFSLNGTYGAAANTSSVKRLRGMTNIHAQDITTLTDGDWQDYSDANGYYIQQRQSGVFSSLQTITSTGSLVLPANQLYRTATDTALTIAQSRNLNYALKTATITSGNYLNYTLNSAGNGIYITNSGEQNALSIYNNGTGTGINIQNLSDGIGGISVSNSTGYSGINVSNTGAGAGVNVTTTGGGTGLTITNTGSANVALQISNNSTGVGLSITGSGTGHKLLVGDGVGSFTRIEPDGTILLTGNATGWKDLSFPAENLKSVGAVSKPDYDLTNLGLLFPQNDTTEKVGILGQMQHDWKEASSIYPHVHYIQTTADTPVFKLKYRIYNRGAAVPTAWTIITVNNHVYQWTSGAGIHNIATFPAIAMTGKTISCQMDMILYRSDNVVTGDVLVKYFDVHYEVDTPAGSRTETSK